MPETNIILSVVCTATKNIHLDKILNEHMYQYYFYAILRSQVVQSSQHVKQVLSIPETDTRHHTE